MLKFLDIIISPRELERLNQQRRAARIPEFKIERRNSSILNSPDFPQLNLQSDTAYSVADSASVDTILNKGVADSIPNQDGIIDTLKASVTYTNGTGAADDTTALILTALVIIAALTLCFCFIRMYRKRLSSICGIH